MSNVITGDASLYVDEMCAEVLELASEGCAVPEAFAAVHDGWRIVSARADRGALDAMMFEAVKTGDEAAIIDANILYLGALNLSSDMRKQMMKPVLQELRATYAPVAKKNYSVIAEKYDAAAEALTRCAAEVDIGMDAKALVGKPQATQKAWLDAEMHAAELDRLTPLLVKAAHYAIQMRDGNGNDRPEVVLALCCEPGDAHRRRVWEAWASTGHRCGRWGALLALGVMVRAADLEALTAYRKPKPLETRTVRDGIGIRQYEVDPEDADYQPKKREQTPVERDQANKNLAAWKLAERVVKEP